MENNNWIYDFESKVPSFLELMQINNYKHFKYTLTGDINKNYNKWGLANTVYAVKIMYITGLLSNYKDVKINNIYKKIISNTKLDGSIYDPFLTKLTAKERLAKFIRNLNNEKLTSIRDTNRAETRQSFAAIYLLNKKPNHPFLNLPKSEVEIESFLSDFDWQYPWHAGSHFSHLLFFLKMNAVFFEDKRDTSLIQAAVNWINNIQNKIDGSWYTGINVPINQKINGAMKVLTGLEVANIKSFNYPEKLIDMALLSTNDAQACDNFNIVYVLYCANKLAPNYRFDDIEKFLMNRLNLYKEYYHPEYGGFSFYKNQSNNVLYGKKLAESKNEPDIHGTTMFTWGLALIDNILDLNLKFKVPLN